jgi:hypothetical protein
VRAQFKGAAQFCCTVYDCHRNCVFVARRGTSAFEYLRCHILIAAIDNDRLEPLTGKFANRGISVTAAFYSDLQITQNAAQHADDLLVGTKNERLQTHSAPLAFVKICKGELLPAAGSTILFFVFVIQQMRYAAQLFRRRLQGLNLLAQLGLLGLLLA